MGTSSDSERLLSWTRDLQSVAQAGLTYSRDPFDRERFERVQHIAAEILARSSAEPLDRALAILRAETGYATPKVDVRAAVFREDKLLLVQEVSDRRWSLPGGWTDVGESASAAAVREVREESGYEVRARKVLGVLDKARHEHPASFWYTYKLVFGCELIGGAPTTSHETTGVDWFARDSLPPLSLERVTPGQIARLFEHHDDETLPTDFD
jgi:ADP-ribose pyrophosphatase YjhB (NUDIX family)